MPVLFTCFNLFIYLGFYVTFNTVQVISRRVVGRAEETSTYSSLGICTVNCRPMASNYQLSHLRRCRESNPGLRGGRRECYHSATVAPCLHSLKRLIYYQGIYEGCVLYWCPIWTEDFETAILWINLLLCQVNTDCFLYTF